MRLLVAVAALLLFAVPASAQGCHHHYRLSHHRRVVRCLAAHQRIVRSHKQRPLSSTPTVRWGATIGSQFTGSSAPFDWSAVNAFESRDAGGKQVSLVPWGEAWHSTAWYGGDGNFPTQQMEKVWEHGATPVLSWSSINEDNLSDPAYTDANIANGSQDAYLTRWAQAAKAWGHPLMLRFDWEMNGNWFPWAANAPGNADYIYVAMWQHIHNIFTAVGATNVQWVWCPNVTNGVISQWLYPNDYYVDWTCLDGYNGDNPWTSFRDVFSSSYQQLMAIAPLKPVLIGETASTESGGSKAQWITSMFNSLPSFPRILGLLWYDVSSNGPGGHSDWPIESSSSAISAFTAGIASARYG